MPIIHHLNTNRGFTLVELMVTIAVMLIITSISVFNYSEFNSVTVTNTLAYDMALAIRQAQQYGVSVREVGGTAQDQPITASSDFSVFGRAYGIHFGQNDLTHFKLFIDTGGVADQYDYNVNPSLDEAIQSYTLQQGSKITSILVNSGAGDIALSGNGFVDIVFKRPNPDTYVTYSLNGGTPITASRTTTVTIRISNSSGALHKDIVVYPSGQIAIQ